VNADVGWSKIEHVANKEGVGWEVVGDTIDGKPWARLFFSLSSIHIHSLEETYEAWLLHKGRRKEEDGDGGGGEGEGG
jgi:hypothetical protein